MEDELRRDIADLREKLTSLRKWAYGNGEPSKGITSRVANLETSMTAMNRALEKLAAAEEKRAHAEDALRNQVKGARAAIVGFAALFGVGGIAGWAWLANLLQRILQQIP